MRKKYPSSQIPVDDFTQKAMACWRIRHRPVTVGREKICLAIGLRDSPFEAEELWREVLERGHRVSLASVYRTIADLLEANLLVEFGEVGSRRSFMRRIQVSSH